MICQNPLGGSPSRVMAKVVDYDFEERVFELHSRYHVHFLTNTLRNGMKPRIHFYQSLLSGRIGHKVNF